MNRRNFLKCGGIAVATTAVITTPVISKPAPSDFPETEEDMRKIIADTRVGPDRYRLEGEMIIDGLCVTHTPSSTFWYYHKGDRVAVLHERPSDNHVCFEVQKLTQPKPVYYPAMNNGKDI